MKRAGRKKKDPNKNMRRRITRETINYMATMTEAILRSEFHFDNEQVDKFVQAVNKYSGFVARDDIKMEYKDFEEHILQERMNWISVGDKLPPVGENVEVCFERISPLNQTKYQIITIAQYQDGKTLDDDFYVSINGDDMEDMGAEYDDERDCYIVPEGWYEFLECISSEYFTMIGGGCEKVTHWRPKPEPPVVEP